MRKIIDLYCSVVPEKSQPSGPPFTGKLDKPGFPLERLAIRLVGIFLSLLNTNDGFYFSHIPIHTRSSGPYVKSMLANSVLI